MWPLLGEFGLELGHSGLECEDATYADEGQSLGDEGAYLDDLIDLVAAVAALATVGVVAVPAGEAANGLVIADRLPSAGARLPRTGDVDGTVRSSKISSASDTRRDTGRLCRHLP